MATQLRRSRMKPLSNRLPELGRMRLGGEKKGNRPGRPLDTFRFTAVERDVLDSIAALYGGDVVPWDEKWQVIVTEKVIPVMIPPPQENWDPCSVTYEHWQSSGWDRRCDGTACITWEQTGDEFVQVQVPCICNASEPPEEICKPITRLNVIVQDIEPLGMFMLSSTGWNAAQELPGLTAALSAAMSRNVMVPATLRIEAMTQKGFAFRNKKNKTGTVHFKKPVLEIRQSVNQLMGDEALALPRPDVDPVTGEMKEAPQITDAYDEEADRIRGVIIDQLGKCNSSDDVAKVEAWIEGHVNDDRISPGLLRLCKSREKVLGQE